MQVLLENAISPWGQFYCHGEIRHTFLNVWPWLRTMVLSFSSAIDSFLNLGVFVVIAKPR